MSYLRVIPVGFVQYFDDDFSLMGFSIVSLLFPNPFEDLGECPLTLTLTLETTFTLLFKNLVSVRYFNFF